MGSKDGWDEALIMQDHQLALITKLYKNNGFELKRTCGAHPEQYDVFKDGKQVAYYRLRHGEFTVDIPYSNGETIYWAYPSSDGVFDPKERLMYLTKALRAVQSRPFTVE